MYLCEMCYCRIYRVKHETHTNVLQNPPVHHFCSHQCKMLWTEFVREGGYVPKAYVEVFKEELLIDEVSTRQ